MKIDPDIYADVNLLPTNRGGLENPISLEKVGCTMIVNGEAFSCFLLIPPGKKVSPGDSVELPIRFLYPELIIKKLEVGDKFELRDFRVFAYGQVRRISG